MKSSHHKSASVTLSQRLIGAVLLLGFILSGIPLPMLSLDSPLEKDHSQPFPCENRTCGCQSATQCWKSCCCFSDRDKVKWARKNNVKPPQFVDDAAEEEWEEENLCGASRGEISNLVSSHLISPKPLAGCCAKKLLKPTKPKPVRPQDSTQDDEKRYVVTAFAGSCQGIPWSFSSLPWAIVPRIPTIKVPCRNDQFGPPLNITVESVALDPPDPPPRLAVAA